MTTENVKNHIKEAIQSFASGNLTKNGLNLFKTLGYNTERQAPLNKPTFSEFKESFISAEKKFDEKNALCKEWKYVDLLFQLSAEEMQHQESLFKATVEREDPASYLFFIIDLGVNAYSRNQLSQIVREVNKIFPMHVFIVFKYASEISLSLIDRRPNKRSDDRDVLEKVTHVYNIKIANPHSGHVHILYSFSFEAISAESRKRRIESFKDLQSGWRRVISTDILNKQFYLNYSQLSVKLIKVVFPDRVRSKLITHQGVLNLLNRIMFLYFVQKKRWLMNDDNFIIHYWNRYKDSGQSNKFHEHWLNTLFFNAFNGKAWEAFKSFKFLPDEIQKEITNFPYLNGGLFLFNKEYDGFILEDKYFEEIFNFFESFIFTITEDTPFDVNLEINPELLGKMYESMINATDLDDVEAENGIIYTERPEINFMTRRSFVEVLDKKLNNKLSREFLYHFIFDDHAQKKEILKRYKVNLLALRQAICTLTVCDPACGSGSMLLGVLQLQMELLRVIDETDKKPHSEKDDFLIKKQLVSDCLYGVDIKEWAVRIAELRLWLYMIAEADFSQEERIKAPLLPNLDFKLRKGNSLLQKIGSLDFSVEDLLNSAKNKNAGASRKLREFIQKKKEFIINQEESNTTYEKLKKEEYEVFYGFIKELIFENENKLSNIGKRGKQLTIIPEPEQIDLELYAEEKESLRVEIEKLKKLKTSIHKEGKLPFSFEIDFMEIFLASDDPGFDLVIGNPPYVRQEQILPPEDGEYLEYLLLPENRHEKAKVNNQYKEILNEKVFKTYPFLSTSFKTKIEEKNKSIPVYGNKVPGRSDLYCYFQLICPSYLNSKGTFCFIISNSWL
ncbi:MAG TPA: hypothetical protein PL123_07395, partial [Bacteroidales bacterium]|nr:hypothetical protein [Bacteroidales bacterium]